MVALTSPVVLLSLAEEYPARVFVEEPALMRRFLFFFIPLFFVTVTSAQVVVINEFMADNDNIIADPAGEYDDWIELFNPGSSAVDLEGYGLSDDSGNPLQWAFPEVSIAAGEYLVVWADDDEGQSGLHTNFKLSASGEEISLSSPAGIVIDLVSFGPQQLDVSYGRYPDGTGSFRSMYATPGAANRPDGPADIDPGEGLFDPFTIHSIDLSFYIENWQDSLEYNFEVLDEEYLPVHVVINDTLELDSVGIRYKGNSTYTRSQGTPKKPLKLKFDKYINGTTAFGLERLNLHNSVSDPTFMRETIAYSILRHYLPAPRTTFADVYVDDELLGFYTVVEQIDELFLARHFEDSNNNLFKAADDGAPLLYRGENPSEYTAEYELKTNEDDNDWTGFIQMIDHLNNTTDTEFIATLDDNLDFDSCLRLLAFNMVLSNFDSYTGSGRNYYFYDLDGSGFFSMLPWDMNESFGCYSNGWDVISQDIFAFNNASDRPLNRRILEQDSLAFIYTDYISEMLDGPASTDSISDMIDLLEPVIESHVLADPNKLYSDDKFYTNLDDDVLIDMGRRVPGLRNFSVLRTENLRDQLNSETVYPGDTNNDGLVDAWDILPIGIHFLTQGSARNSSSISWSAQRVTPWEEIEATYADANGDGIVDEKDVVAIGFNYGETHDLSSVSFFVDLSDNTLIYEHHDSFIRLYHSISGSGVAANAMRELLLQAIGNDTELPVNLELEQNYPNPFNQTTRISFTLPSQGRVSLSLINILGQVVSQPICRQQLDAGSHTFSLDASKLPSGIYFYRLETADGTRTRKLVLSK